jgi:HEAT repeat protein
LHWLANGRVLNHCQVIDLRAGKVAGEFGFLGRYQYYSVQQVLPNSNLLVCHHGGLVEVDLNGNVLWRLDKASDPRIARATRLRNGDTLLKKEGDSWVWTQVDCTGKPVWELPGRWQAPKDFLPLVRLEFGRPAGPWRVDSVASRLRQLRHKEADMRAHAATMLQECSDEARIAVPSLVEALDDPERSVRQAAIRSLTAIGPHCIDGVIAALKDKRTNVRAGAAESLKGVGTGKGADAAVAGLVEALDDKEVMVRVNALSSLTWFRERAAGAVPAVARLVTDGNETVAASAAQVLGYLGPSAGNAIDTLIYAMKDRRAAVASSAAWSLQQLGPMAAKAVPALLKAAQRDEEDVRQASFSALGGIGPAAAPTADFLAKALLDERYSGCRWEIADALGGLGPSVHRGAIPPLVKALRTKSYGRARIAAARALGKFGANGGLAALPLAEALSDKLPGLAQEAARALENLGAVARDAIPGLIAAVQSPETTHHQRARERQWIRTAAIRALGSMGPLAKAALPALEKAQTEKYFYDDHGHLQTVIDPSFVPPDGRQWAILDPDFRPALGAAIKKIRGD